MWEFSTKVLINWKHFIGPRHFLFFLVQLLQKPWENAFVNDDLCYVLHVQKNLYRVPPKWQSNIKMQDQGPCVQVIFDIQSDATWLMCHDAFKCIFATYFLANVVLCDRNVSLPWIYCNNDSTGFGND